MNIEIFTDRSVHGDDLIKQVEERACPACKITVYDRSDDLSVGDVTVKIKEYGIITLPCIVFNGRLLTPEQLSAAKPQTS